MKKTILTTLGIFCGSMAVSQAALVAHFDGSSNTSLVNGYTLANTGVATNVVGGQYGTAYEFDDTNADSLQATLGYAGLGNNALGNSFTVMAWYNLDTDANPAGNGSDRHFLWENSSDFDFSYALVNAATLDPVATRQTFLGGNQQYGTYTKGTWEHVAQTITIGAGNSITEEIFINGVSQGSRTSTVAGFNDTAINFGRARDSASDRPFDGKMDDIKLYDEVLTAAEIQTAMTPEPSSAALLGLGGLALILRRRK